MCIQLGLKKGGSKTASGSSGVVKKKLNAWGQIVKTQFNDRTNIQQSGIVNIIVSSVQQCSVTHLFILCFAVANANTPIEPLSFCFALISSILFNVFLPAPLVILLAPLRTTEARYR
jgi:hypothetical protein